MVQKSIEMDYSSLRSLPLCITILKIWFERNLIWVDISRDEQILMETSKSELIRGYFEKS